MGYSAQGTRAVFLEVESASADAHIVHPCCKATGYYTLIKKPALPRVFALLRRYLFCLLGLELAEAKENPQE